MDEERLVEFSSAFVLQVRRDTHLRDLGGGGGPLGGLWPSTLEDIFLKTALVKIDGK